MADDSQILVVESPKASSVAGPAAEIAADETRTSEVTFTPSKPSGAFSQEVYGTVNLMETSIGEVEYVDGTRVQHTHDRVLYRLLEEILDELRELRNSEKGA